MDAFGPLFFSRVAMLAASHARQMGSFAFVYRGMQVLMHGTGLSYASPLMSAVPGFIGGAWIHGVKSPISDQLNMYVMARTFMTLVQSAAERVPSIAETPMMGPYREDTVNPHHYAIPRDVSET